jgi:hypothetical protein
MIEQAGLSMTLIDVEMLLGGERIVFYFMAEGRVDFRELVRELAGEFHTRIEMRQVGARDEARLVADYEKCGQHCCCKQFLKVLKPVSMRNAKIQKATLDPSKISGRCGRLMCCLRYEEQTYDDLRKRLPHRNRRVMTEDGLGTVVNTQILTQLVLVNLDSSPQRAAYPVENIRVLNKAEEQEILDQQQAERDKADAERKQQQRERRRSAKQAKADNASADQPPQPADPAGASTGGDESQGGGSGKRRKRRRRRRRRKGGGGGDGGGDGGGGGSSE